MRRGSCWAAASGGTRSSGQRWRHAIPSASAPRIGFDERLAHLIEAGADAFLMPSRFEPCGLNQMYSLRYGTVPIVRATGGLDDTVEDGDPRPARAPDSSSGSTRPAALVAAVRRALDAYRNRDVWQSMQRNGDAAGSLLGRLGPGVCQSV